MLSPNIVSHEEWLEVRKALLAREKALTRAHDDLAAERRRLPWEKVGKDYAFDAPDGKANLADLFDRRRQLIVYHHMLRPADEHPCPGCCMVVDNIGNLAHLYARDTTLVLVSRAPIAEIETFRKRMGWTIRWFSTADDFNSDFGVVGGSGLNVFLRDGGDIFHPYFTTGRGVEALGSVWTFLDLTPLGRQESWEDSPEGAPHTTPYQ
jgi:predicted dithiol-disulfide oxidoreductase (DUF899 family)